MTAFMEPKMTSSIPPNKHDRLCRGFTLVEMLVVVGIIVVLVGILLPMLTKAQTRAMRTRMQLDVQTLVAAMENYKADMRDYPHIDYNDAALVGSPPGGAAPAASNPGAVVLCSALVGPGGVNVDGYGATGVPTGTGIQGAPGFTIRPRGQVYGPYIDVSRFKFIADPTMSNSATNVAGNLESNLCLADRYNHPILYFKANINAAYRLAATASTTASGGYIADIGPTGPAAGSTMPFYNIEDNPVAMRWPNETTNSSALARMQMMLGDKDHDGWINAFSAADGLPENPKATAPYLIWSAGPDELFCFDPSDSGGVAGSIGTLGVAYTKSANSDDATNFSN
jgi:prepilin-type N-terminal cleavage/methylation domain-containing protein